MTTVSGQLIIKLKKKDILSLSSVLLKLFKIINITITSNKVIQCFYILATYEHWIYRSQFQGG